MQVGLGLPSTNIPFNIAFIIPKHVLDLMVNCTVLIYWLFVSRGETLYVTKDKRAGKKGKGCFCWLLCIAAVLAAILVAILFASK